MSREKYIFGAVVTLSFIFGLSFLSAFSSKSTNDFLVTAFTIMSGICSIVGIGFAFAIYRRLGIDETIISRKSEVVFKFLEDLRQLNFTIETNDKTLLVSFNRLQSFIQLDVYNNHYSDILLLHNKTIGDIHHIVDQSNNLFMPIEIAEALRPLDFGQVYKEGQEIVNVAKASTNDRSKVWTNSKKHNYKEGEDFYGLPDSKEMTFKEFLTQWDLVVSRTLEWIHNNTSEQRLNYPKKFDEIDLKIVRRMIKLENWG